MKEKLIVGLILASIGGVISLAYNNPTGYEKAVLWLFGAAFVALLTCMAFFLGALSALQDVHRIVPFELKSKLPELISKYDKSFTIMSVFIAVLGLLVLGIFLSTISPTKSVAKTPASQTNSSPSPTIATP